MKQKKLAMTLAWVLILCTILSTTAFAANVTTVAKISQSTTAALNYLKDQFGTTGDTYTIPGLMQTITRESTANSSGEYPLALCNGMVPQGLAFCGPSGKYLLISAYCGCGSNHRSVIYVIDASSKEYQVTLITDTTCHVGGLAYDGTYVWVADSESSPKCLRAYKYSSVEDAITHNYWTVYTQATCAVDATPSYMCYANNLLYIGTFSETAETMKMYFYETNGLSMTKKGSFTVNGVTKIQGMSIRNGCMILTSSYGRTNKSNGYIFTDPGSRFTRDGAVYNASDAKHISLPNMAEGVYIGATYTYFLFESGAATYRSSANTMPLDQYIRLKHDVIGVTLNETPAPKETRISDGVCIISNVGDSTRSLNVRGSSTAEGAQIELQQSAKSNAQRFAFQRGSDGYYTIRNVNSGKLLQVASGASKVTQAADSNSDTQKWRIMDNQDGTFSFINVAADKYLDLNNNNLANGTDIQIWKTNGSDAQKWKLQYTVPLGVEGNYYLAPQNNKNLVLDCDGTNAVVAVKSEANRQKFALKAVNDSYFTITSIGYGMNLKAESNAGTYGTNVGLGTTMAGGADLSERWQLVPNGDGTYGICSPYNTLYLDVANGTMADGTNIQNWGWNGTDAQRWTLTTAPLEVHHTYVATDNGNGTHTKVCSQCFASETEPHIMKITHVDPTRTQNGYDEHACTVCGYTYRDNEVSLKDLTDKLCFSQASLLLTSDISMKFYVKEEVLEGWKSPVVTFTKELYDAAGEVTGTEEKQVSDYTVSGDYRVYTFTGINATEMSSKITAVISANRGTLCCAGVPTQYSVTEYVTKMYQEEVGDELKTLLADMLNYGAEAQTYFNYNLTHLANSVLTTEQAACATKAVPDLTSALKVLRRDGADVHFANSTLSLKNRVTMNLYLDLGDYTPEELYARISRNGTAVVVEGSDFYAKENADGTVTYVVSYAGLDATQMRTACTVEVFDKATNARVSDTLTYSIESYAAVSTGKLRTLTNAMMVYGDSAEIYFKNR